jgi:hypothetical protein
MNNSAGRASRFPVNRWADAVDRQVGDWLSEHGATYGTCHVDDDTRVLSWWFPRGSPYGGRGRRHRALAFRALHGDLDRWEIVYREQANGLAGGPVRYYASTAHSTDLAGLQHTAAALAETGLPHLTRATATCGHPGTGHRHLTTIGLVAAFLIALAATVAAALDGISDLVWVLVAVLVVLTVAIAVRAAATLVGFRRSGL